MKTMIPSKRVGPTAAAFLAAAVGLVTVLLAGTADAAEPSAGGGALATFNDKQINLAQGRQGADVCTEDAAGDITCHDAPYQATSTCDYSYAVGEPGRSDQHTAAVAEPAPRMTPREREVLALVGTGLSNQDIASQMNIGITTVKTHIARLMERTGSANRVHLALLAIRHQITPTPRH